MQQRRLHESNGQRTFVVVLDTGDEVAGCLRSFAEQQGILAAQITGIGALSEAVLLYFDWPTKAYQRIPVREQVEVVALLGDIAEAPTKCPEVHVHMVLGKRDGSTVAGHLGEAYVRPTLEVIVTESPAHLRKVKDPESGLALIRPAAEPRGKGVGDDGFDGRRTGAKRER